MNEVFKLTEVIRYTKYEPSTALVILVNDVLNLHLRPKSIGTLNINNLPLKVTVDINLVVDPEILTDGGKYYTGLVSVTYDKINISTVYPGGFLISKWMGLESILKTLKDSTGVQISKDDCELMRTGDIRTLTILPSSLFWHGSLIIKTTEPLIVIESGETQTTDIGTILNGDSLSGFTKTTLSSVLNRDTLDGFKPASLYDILNQTELDGFVFPE